MLGNSPISWLSRPRHVCSPRAGIARTKPGFGRSVLPPRLHSSARTRTRPLSHAVHSCALHPLETQQPPSSCMRGGPRPPASPPFAARKRCRRPAGRIDDSVGCCPWPTMLPPRPLPHTMEPELLRLVPPWRSSVWSYRAQRVGEAARRPRPTEAHPTPPLPTKPHLYLHSRAPPPLSVPSLFSRRCRGIVCESCARKPHLHASIKPHSDDGALSSPP